MCEGRIWRTKRIWFVPHDVIPVVVVVTVGDGSRAGILWEAEAFSDRVDDGIGFFRRRGKRPASEMHAEELSV
ncbi:hypothetical protein JVT61DRAFT_6368 [Boletus reticuloceps]|uniref:Uncharacterized protein n=1 Tax=Boletus reticuloceps TaxID=495285 RepID=A0A8I2YKT1_9AGAM|nr:hypothetical protein JVT61DRAFT_6368 [Boletus reticuloceps]